MSPLTPGLSGDAPDELVPDRQVAREFNVSLMTLWRWDRDPKLAELGWDARQNPNAKLPPATAA
jgi:hypothetical protein